MKQRRQLRREAARGVGGHRMARGRDGWKCQDCGRQARTSSGARKMVSKACGGHLTTRISTQEDKGPAAHVLWTAEADDTQMEKGSQRHQVLVCGAYPSTKLYKLRGLCAKSGADAFARAAGATASCSGVQVAKAPPHDRSADGYHGKAGSRAEEQICRGGESDAPWPRASGPINCRSRSPAEGWSRARRSHVPAHGGDSTPIPR